MYGKSYESMYEGSMVGAGINVFAVWNYIITKARGGAVEINPRLLAFTLGGREEEVASALEFLQQPDPISRSKDCEGRRLIKDGQFQYRVVNWEKYQEIKNAADKREYNRVKQAEYRANKTQVVTTAVFSDDSRLALKHLNEKSGRKFRETTANMAFIQSRLSEPGVDIAGVKLMIDRQVIKWRGDPKMEEYLRPETLFNKTKFDSYYAAKDIPVNGAGSVTVLKSTPPPALKGQQQDEDTLKHMASQLANLRKTL